MTVRAQLARVIRRTSLNLPINHPDQQALYAAHAALMAQPLNSRKA